MRATTVAIILCTTLGVGPGLLASAGCKVRDPPPIDQEWSDLFERDTIGGNYYKTGGGHRVAKGALSTKGSYNKPLWLRKKLPRDVQIDVTAWSNSPAGDIKLEVFGDGRSYDPDRGGYTSTGYVVIFGGWNNSKSMIARGDEHGKELVERTLPRVVVGQKYQWRIVRKGKKLTWYVDDLTTPFLEYDDPRPFEGPGHEYLGFNNWESDSWFDDLRITAL
ncbi:MAG: hypothetical protein KBG28_01005 [Kofleriaceae bacterium]|jgi:hypothetical protein|nr:hypothetical protein [Kofleriaceae bacterium]MBP6840982.1 hypothetical protein [Kofleriaceae bacterium]MBP9202529.1 hypothetical protein [Kofleriaceae bacterium]